MGCYPLFVCDDWSRLEADLDELGDELVSLALVTDPFGAYEPDELRAGMPDVMVPFKPHFVVDLHRRLDAFAAGHHRRNARRALRELCIERCDDPSQFIADWVALYAHLIDRHRVRGLAAFSETALRRQLAVPGLVMFRACVDDHTLGMILWYLQGRIGYYHLGAYSPRGYELRASFGLFSYAIRYFAATGVRWLDLGGGAGIENDGTDGLSRFKRGWSTGTRTTYFCGRIFNRNRYDELTAARGAPSTEFFPAYRLGEFA